jgi:hypothetical protein
LFRRDISFFSAACLNHDERVMSRPYSWRVLNVLPILKASLPRQLALILTRMGSDSVVSICFLGLWIQSSLRSMTCAKTTKPDFSPKMPDFSPIFFFGFEV